MHSCASRFSIDRTCHKNWSSPFSSSKSNQIRGVEEPCLSFCWRNLHGIITVVRAHTLRHRKHSRWAKARAVSRIIMDRQVINRDNKGRAIVNCNMRIPIPSQVICRRSYLRAPNSRLSKYYKTRVPNTWYKHRIRPTSRHHPCIVATLPQAAAK